MANIFDRGTFTRTKNEATGNIYTCKFCENQYKTYSGVKTHIRRHHREHVPMKTTTSEDDHLTISRNTVYPHEKRLALSLAVFPKSFLLEHEMGTVDEALFEREQQESFESRKRPTENEKFILAEIERLRAADARRDEEDRRRQDQERMELKEKLKALTTQLQQNGRNNGGDPLDAKLDRLESERKTMAEENQKLREQLFSDKLGKLESIAVSRNQGVKEELLSQLKTGLIDLKNMPRDEKTNVE